MRSFQFAGAGSQTSMPIPSDQDFAVLSFSAVAPGPTSSLTRHRSAAAVIGGLGTSPAASSSPFLIARTARTIVFSSGRKAVLRPSSQASCCAAAEVIWLQAVNSKTTQMFLRVIIGIVSLPFESLLSRCLRGWLVDRAAQEQLADTGIAEHTVGLVDQAGLAQFEHDAEIRDLQCRTCIRLDQEDRDAAIAQLLQDAEGLPDQQRREPDRRLVDQHQLRVEQQAAG